MKKLFFHILIITGAFCNWHPACAQEANAAGKDPLSRMITCFNGTLYDSAAAISDAHINDPEYSSDSKFWFYRGLAYKEMFKRYERNKPKSADREKSEQALKKSLGLEKDPDIIADIKKNVKYIAATYHNDAVKILQKSNPDVSLSIYDYDKYIDLMKLIDAEFNEKEQESEFLNALGSVYAHMFAQETDIHADAYYQLAKSCFQKVLAYDSSQASAKYNLVVLETNYKTKQERLLKDESDKKDQVILSLNAVKKLADEKLKESQLEEESKKKELIILKSEQEKKGLEAKAEQDKKDAIAQRDRETQRIILWIVIAGLFIVMVFAAIIYRNSQQKERLNKELTRLSFVVSKSTNTVLIFNEAMELEWVNDTFLNIYGMTLEEYKKDYGIKLSDVSNYPKIEQLAAESIRRKEGVAYESVTETKNMGKRWFQSMLTPVFDAGGKLQNMMVIDSDITLLKNVEEELRQKNKDITDSIQYARRIQQSILPSDKKVKGLIPEHFILYQSKDIVSGDFYWIGGAENNNKIVAAAVDCTGHGVPGALLTIIGNDLLNHIVVGRGITNPAEILKEMNAGIISRFDLTEEEDSREGMDMSVFTIDRSGGKTVLSFAGAYNPLYCIRDNELTELAPVRYHIGSIPVAERNNITCHTLEVKKGDMFYLFSDGYADQLSGQTGKKYMKGRFKQLLLDIHKLPMKEQRKTLENKHFEWRGATFQTDDMLVMGFQF